MVWQGRPQTAGSQIRRRLAYGGGGRSVDDRDCGGVIRGLRTVNYKIEINLLKPKLWNTRLIIHITLRIQVSQVLGCTSASENPTAITSCALNF